ncbi:endonuclease V [Sporosarcina sp. P21c]|nr:MULTISPECIES: endonuclease V [unclassified Sporosarcina]PIC66154.1 endonuclease V [Sporosarcina sp. P16a]PIC88795.1 endonuclease V [Sporosarcina sp. P21c]PIC91818.1 endonuclease V [Sporosarcina sp. P25]
MNINIQDIHPLSTDKKKWNAIQTCLKEKISMVNRLTATDIKFIAGVDVAYWEDEGIEWGVCSIIVMDYATKAVIEETNSTGIVVVPYIPGYLAFRELPLVIEAARKLQHAPDLFMFDGNGYLHPRHMGIATHASFFLNKPTIGIAKSYLKIANVEFEMPENRTGSYVEIVINREIYGRVLRTHQDVKPIFVSCGNYIDLPTATTITKELLNSESRLPIPVRLADLATKRNRRRLRDNK